MMKDISMHILDIVQNSINAKATYICIAVIEDVENNIMFFSVYDNGIGMLPELLEVVKDPFTTSRNNRRVGLGIPLLEQTCQQCGGKLEINSVYGEYTIINACMEYNNIDRPPLGNMADIAFLLIATNLNVEFKYGHSYNKKEYLIDTRELKKTLEGVELKEPDIMKWLKENIMVGILDLYS